MVFSVVSHLRMPEARARALQYKRIFQNAIKTIDCDAMDSDVNIAEQNVIEPTSCDARCCVATTDE